MTGTLPAVEPPGFAPPWDAGQPRFAPGDAVRVRPGHAPGHVRTPWYVRGRLGRIERICGAFPNPEQLAFGLDAPRVPLYRVRFAMAELWGAAAERPGDTTDVEIFEHWLDPV